MDENKRMLKSIKRSIAAAKGILREFKRKTKTGKQPSRRKRNSNWDTTKLLAHLEGVKILMRESNSWEELIERLNKHYPIVETTELGFEVQLSK